MNPLQYQSKGSQRKDTAQVASGPLGCGLFSSILTLPQSDIIGPSLTGWRANMTFALRHLFRRNTTEPVQPRRFDPATSPNGAF
jgi:hypothetical protein